MIRARRLLASESVGLITVLVAGLIVMTLLSPSFLTAFNLYVLLRSACVSLLVAFAQMICLGVGQMNLSLGGLGGLIAILLGGMLEVLGIPLPIAIMAALALGVMGGVINGLLTVRTGINGFIITLASASAFTGINYGLTEAVPFYKMPPALVAFGTGRIGPIPYLLIVPMIVAPALSLFLFRTLPGRRLLAVGGNSYAAALSGISAAGAVVLAHCISGTLAAIAAILAVAQLGTAQPLIGSDWLLISFAAPIIGGTVLGGGHVSVVGASIAVLIVALIQNGLILAKVDPYWVQFLLGALVLTTVGLNRWHAVRTRKAMG